MGLVDYGDEIVQEPVVHHILALATELGGRVHENKKLMRKRYKAIVSEIYSPPCVIAAAAKLTELDIDSGVALDFTTVDENGEEWDFDKPKMKEKARRIIREQKPELLIGSPMCTMYSA